MASARPQTKRGGKLRGWGLLVLAAWLVGCTVRHPGEAFRDSLSHYQDLAGRIEYPDVHSATLDPGMTAAPPVSVNRTDQEPWPLTPDQAVQIALANSTILRELGGQVLGIVPDEINAASGADAERQDGLVRMLIDLRADARAAKDFATADRIRDQLAGLGIVLEDRPDGTIWRVE